MADNIKTLILFQLLIWLTPLMNGMAKILPVSDRCGMGMATRRRASDANSKRLGLARRRRN
jgi:hypothetical protein